MLMSPLDTPMASSLQVESVDALLNQIQRSFEQACEMSTADRSPKDPFLSHIGAFHEPNEAEPTRTEPQKCSIPDLDIPEILVPVAKEAAHLFATTRSVVAAGGQPTSLGNFICIVASTVYHYLQSETIKDYQRLFGLCFLLKGLTSRVVTERLNQEKGSIPGCHSQIVNVLSQCVQMILDILAELEVSHPIDFHYALNLLLQVLQTLHLSPPLISEAQTMLPSTSEVPATPPPTAQCLLTLLNCMLVESPSVQTTVKQFLIQILSSETIPNSPAQALFVQTIKRWVELSLAQKATHPSRNSQLLTSALTAVVECCPSLGLNQRYALFVDIFLKQVLGNPAASFWHCPVLNAFSAYALQQTEAKQAPILSAAWNMHRKMVSNYLLFEIPPSLSVKLRYKLELIDALMNGVNLLIVSCEPHAASSTESLLFAEATPSFLTKTDSSTLLGWNDHQLFDQPTTTSTEADQALLKQSTQLSMINSLLAFMVNDRRSFLKSVSGVADPSIQLKLARGWSHIVESAAKVPLLIYPIVVPHFLSFLSSLHHKPIWVFVILCCQALFESGAKATQTLYRIFGSTAYTVSTHLYVTAVSFSETLENASTPTQMQGSLDEINTLLKQAHTQGFGPWYSAFSQLLFEQVFQPLVYRLCHILREVEEPSAETLCLLEKTVTEEFSLMQLKSQDASNYRNELRKCIASAFHLFGSKLMLSCASLSLSNLLTTPLACESFAYTSNSWVLPLLSKCVKRDHLEFFQTNLLTLAENLIKKAPKHCDADGPLELIEIRHYKRLAEQIWSLLPNYMVEPLDGPDCLLQSTLGTMSLMKQILAKFSNPMMQKYICSAFINLSRDIESALEAGEAGLGHLIWTTSQSASLDQVKKAMASIAKQLSGMIVVQFLQLHKELQGSHQQSKNRLSQLFLTTISSLIPFCDNDFLRRNVDDFSAIWEETVRHATEILRSSDNPREKSNVISYANAAVVEIVERIIPLLPCDFFQVSFDRFFQLFVHCCEGLANFKVSAQKKAFGDLQHSAAAVLQGLMKRSLKGLKSLLTLFESQSEPFALNPSVVVNYWKGLTDARVTSRMHALKHRMLLLHSLVVYLRRLFWTSWLSHPDRQSVVVTIMKDLVPEILISLEEPSTAIRTACSEMLLILQNEFCSDLIQSLLPGLGGRTTLMKTATIDAITILAKGNHTSWSPSLTDELMSLMIVLLKDHTQPQQFVATVRAIKAIQHHISSEDLPAMVERYVGPLFESPFALSCRLQIKYLLDKLIKKAGYQEIMKVFPSEHLPLLRHVHKAATRAKQVKDEERKRPAYTHNSEKHTQTASSDEDDDDDSDHTKSHTESSSAPKTIQLRASQRNIPAIKSLMAPFDLDDDSEKTDDEADHGHKKRPQPFDSVRLVDDFDEENFDLGDPDAHHVLLGSSSKKLRTKSGSDVAKPHHDGKSCRAIARSHAFKFVAKKLKHSSRRQAKPGKQDALDASSTGPRIHANDNVRKGIKKHAVSKSVKFFSSNKSEKLGSSRSLNKMQPYVYIHLNPDMLNDPGRAVKYLSSVTKPTKKTGKRVNN